MSVVTVEDVQNRFGLEILAGGAGIERKILTSDISRPGLEMAGYFDFYLATRVQLLGKTEISFFTKLPEEERRDRMDRLCTIDTPAFILAHNIECPPELVQIAERAGHPRTADRASDDEIFRYADELSRRPISSDDDQFTGCSSMFMESVY